MKKMTPMILVILMLTSFLSAIDVYELQEESNNEETSARAEADPEVVYVTSPRETKTSGNTVTNEMLAGEPTNFKAYLRNSGDADLTNMQYSVTVYDSNNGQRGNVAQDNQGNELAWNNDKAICSNSCQNTVLAAGEFLDGGESTLMTTAGNVIEWIPEAGDYFVEVRVTSQVLGDPGNNELSFPVSVRDYHDIVVDLTWLDDAGNSVRGAIDGTAPVDFKLSVTLTGSMASSMSLHNTTLNVQVTGGTVDSSTQLFEVLGDSMTSTISVDDQANEVTAQRLVIGATGDMANPVAIGEGVYTLTPPTDGDYSVSVSIESYTVVDEQSCTSPDVVCERQIAGVDAEDEYNSNNYDSIYGSAETVHDIRLDGFYLATMATGEPNPEAGEPFEEGAIADTYGFLGGEIEETLSTGEYLIVAEVVYSSSSNSALYEWNVTFTITDKADNSATVYYGTNCSNTDYDAHIYLGESTTRTDADTIGYACVTHDFSDGDYTVEAHANMLGMYDEDESSVDDKVVDMISVNNVYDFDIEVVNFAPEILVLKYQNELVKVGDSIVITVEAFDVEGDRITYQYNDGFGDAITCEELGTNICRFTADISMVPSQEVVVTIDDGTSTDIDSVVVTVYDENSYSSTDLAEGFAAVYTVAAKSSGLSVTFADGPTDAVSTASCANSPTPVGSVVVNPSTTYDSSVLISQSITVHFPTNLGVMAMWMSSGNQVLPLVSGVVDEVDSTTSGYTHNFAAGVDMLPPGTTFYLIADQCETPDPPSGTITQLTATPAMGGDIVIAYNYSNMLSDENVRIEVTMADGTTPEVTYDRVDTDTRSVTWASGTDGQAYTVTAQLCNEYDCGASVSASVTSDASVAAVTATSVTITESGENWVVAWEPSAVDDDVAGWYVCYNRGEFTSSEMKIMIDAGACTMVMDGTTATIAKYTTVETTQVHFGIVPHDAVMNVAYGASTDSILYDRAQDTTNPGDGDTLTDTDDASSGVPTWTWGVIGAVVVVAFVVGAFILSRGEGEDDDDKEWDY